MSGAPPGGGFLDGLVRFVRWYEGVAEGAARWYRENEPAIRRIVDAGLDFAEGFPIAMAATSATFARGGWSEVPLGNMELGELTRLVERLWDEPDDGVVRRELDGALLAYFRHDGHVELSEMVDGWREHFEGRHETFEQALHAHKEGLYRLTIPALAAQIEGILRDLTREYGEGRLWIRRFNEAFGFDYHPRRPPPPPDLENEMSRFAALPAVERYAAAEEMRRRFTLRRINELYDSGDFADSRYASSVRRHAILHGVFDGFGELESLRLFSSLSSCMMRWASISNASGSRRSPPSTSKCSTNGATKTLVGSAGSGNSLTICKAGRGSEASARSVSVGSPCAGVTRPALLACVWTRRGGSAGLPSMSRLSTARPGSARRRWDVRSDKPEAWGSLRWRSRSTGTTPRP